MAKSRQARGETLIDLVMTWVVPFVGLIAGMFVAHLFHASKTILMIAGITGLLMGPVIVWGSLWVIDRLFWSKRSCGKPANQDEDRQGEQMPKG